MSLQGTTEPPLSPTGKQRQHSGECDECTTSLSHDDIARLAYEIYRRSGLIDGRCVQNWYQAQYELRRQRIRDAFMSKPATTMSGAERYSEILNGKNPRGDAKLMQAVAETKPGKAKRVRPKAQPISHAQDPSTQVADLKQEASP